MLKFSPGIQRKITYLYGGLALLCVGTFQMFSLYAQNIKLVTGFNQAQTNLLGEMLVFGVYCGPIIGILVDFFSPSTNMFLAAALSCCGYLPIGLLINRNNNASLLALFMFLAGLGCGIAYSNILTNNIRNYKHAQNRRGIIVGSLLAMIPLGASIFSQLYPNFFRSASNFLIFLGILAPILFLMGAVLIQRVPKESNDSDCTTSVPEKSAGIEIQGESAMEEIGNPILKVSVEGKLEEGRPEEPDTSELHTLLAKIRQVQKCISGLGKDVDFWLSFLIFFLGMGGGYMLVNNVGNVIKSINGGVDDKNMTAICVTLISIMTVTGRSLAGATDCLKYRRGVYLVLALLLLSASHFVNAFALQYNLALIYVTSIVVGLGNGLLFSMTSTIVSEKYDAKDYGTIWGWYTLAPASGTIAANVLAGFLYDLHTPAGTTNCSGNLCYRDSFIIYGSITLGAALVGITLVPKTKSGNGTLNTMDK